jgi:FixJ family two-component response regulator
MSDIPPFAVVDDDEAIRDAIQSLLRAMGLRAVQAALPSSGGGEGCHR